MIENLMWRRPRALAFFASAALILASAPMPRAFAQRTVAADAVPNGDAAHGADLLARRVTVDLNDVSRIRAIHALSENAKVFVQYVPQVFNNYRELVSLHVTNVPLRAALDQILKGTPLRVIVDEAGQVGIVDQTVAVNDSLESGTGTITGRVTDSASGRGVGQATVAVQGTKITELTSTDGAFTLHDVPVGEHAVTIKLLGYRPVTRRVDITNDGKSTLRVTLVTTATVLSGVVTTATGTQRKLEVGNDITTLDVPALLKTAPINSVTDLLESRVPGLTVVRSSGRPGQPSRIRLRTATSINENNDPIVIVDGVRVYSAQSDARNGQQLQLVSNLANGAPPAIQPSPLDQIDPSSIEQIEVFKGPSASSLYGSDAANGVIVITTKHGQSGQTHWSVRTDLGTSAIPGKWPTNYYRFGASVLHPSVSGLCTWDDVTCDVDSTVPFQALNDKRYTSLGRGNDQTLSSTVSGGVQALTYSLTATAANNVGVFKMPEVEFIRFRKFYGRDPDRWMRRPDNYKTWGVSGQLAAQPTAGANITVQSSLFSSDQQQSSLGGSITQLQAIYLDASELSQDPIIAGIYQRANNHSLTSTNAATGSWQVLPWLPLNATVGINTVTGISESYQPYGLVNDGASDTVGNYAISRRSSQDNTLTFGSSGISVSRFIILAAGVNIHQQSTGDVSAATDHLTPGVDRPTNFSPVLGSLSEFNQQAAASSTYGWYLEPRLNFNSRFFVSPGFRFDGGSASGASGGVGGGLFSLFPKLNFSWLAVDPSNQAPLLGVVSLLRPRLAFGLAGTQPGPADKLRLYTVQSATIDGSTPASIAQLTTFGNTELRPERSSELEYGFDTELWHGRFAFTLTGYTKTRKDAIQSVALPLSLSTGNTASISVLENIGVVRATGLELTSTTTLLQRQAVNWSVTGTLSRQTNRVGTLAAGRTPDKGLGIVPGYPLFGLWGTPIVSFADADNNGIITDAEVRYGDTSVYLGQPSPRFESTFNTALALLNGRLALNAAFSYQDGLTQTRSNSYALLGLAANNPDATLATQAAIIGLGSVAGSRSTIGSIQTVNTFRVTSATVRYALPRSIAARLRSPSASVALQGSNLWLHTNYTGKDPNVGAGSGGSGGEITQDYGLLPQPREWRLSLTLGN